MALLTSVSLTSCHEEDRVIEVSCNPAVGELISMGVGAPRSVVGYIAHPRAYSFSVGTILELIPRKPPALLGGERVLYTVTPSAQRYLPKELQSLSGTVLNSHFAVRAEPDVLNQSGDLGAAITRSTGFYYEAAQRTLLRDPLAMINSDSSAVRAIQTGMPGSRFVVVSGAWSGGHFNYFLKNSPLVFSLKAGRYYLHVKYSCDIPGGTGAPPASLDSSVRSEPHLLFSYLPIKYDRASHSVVPNPSPIDLTAFSSAPNSMP